MIVEGGGKYNVRLIPQTCNREEAIREIVGALDHLNAISDEIFATVKTRLNSHREKVETLSTRVNIASEQVAALRGSQKAIRIYSPAKYPCDDKETTSIRGAFGPKIFPTLVANFVPDTLVLGHDIEEDEESRCRRPFRFDTPIKHPNDLLSVFHVKEPKLGDLTQLDNMADVGLGRPPSTIRNMDSFFLFNTVDNPYINYKMTEKSLQDRHYGTLKPTRRGEEVHAEACPVVSPENDRASEQKTDVDDFYYSPSALEIPNIDVPESLPDLPGIAESFDISDIGMPKSSPFFPNVSAAVPSGSSKISHNSTPSSLSFVQENENDCATIHSNKPSIGILPSPLEETKVPGVETARLPVDPPPPPPPPPPPVIVKEGPSRDDVQKSAVSAPEAGGDLRCSLMAAIREAGGSGKARLKSAKDRKYEAKRKKQDEKEKTTTKDLQEGGDLMADLKNSLAMRRRGISGIQDGPKRAAPGAVGDIMLSLAATIPTLENSIESSSDQQGGSDDDDWE